MFLHLLSNGNSSSRGATLAGKGWGEAPSFGFVSGSRITGRAIQRLVPRSGHIMLFTFTSPERGGDQIRVYFSRDDAQAAAQQGQCVLRVAIRYVGWPSI